MIIPSNIKIKFLGKKYINFFGYNSLRIKSEKLIKKLIKISFSFKLCKYNLYSIIPISLLCIFLEESFNADLVKFSFENLSSIIFIFFIESHKKRLILPSIKNSKNKRKNDIFSLLILISIFPLKYFITSEYCSSIYLSLPPNFSDFLSIKYLFIKQVVKSLLFILFSLYALLNNSIPGIKKDFKIELITTFFSASDNFDELILFF